MEFDKYLLGILISQGLLLSYFKKQLNETIIPLKKYFLAHILMSNVQVLNIHILGEYHSN
ncbi:Hypothetical protein I595_3254 [Croceitalea dokdonensis DOKDO 023]|uniref:Uncharacterized protein n=1 Tax=Croceitalea dokdonensis DOKDO 023 TaxID=1300341 RepID=A0A0P7A2P7_9FLAO|nr:Hypothetical protein I595_3254 [Croceitalea dokdonensis DOKDO 023]